MADRQHPKEHSDTGSRKQPLSPQHEGIDPLTEGDKLYPREDVKGDATKEAKKEAKAEPEVTPENKAAAETVQAQEERAVDPAAAKEAAAKQETTTDSGSKTSSNKSK